MSEHEEWEAGIYGKHEKWDFDYWHRVCEIIATRDHYRCQSCFKRLFRKTVTVHHIIPRRECGTDDPDNLITLCRACHDIIEETDFRTKTEIVGYCHDPAATKKRVDEERAEDRRKMLARIDDERPEWHARVYGGQRSKVKWKR